MTKVQWSLFVHSVWKVICDGERAGSQGRAVGVGNCQFAGKLTGQRSSLHSDFASTSL